MLDGIKSIPFPFFIFDRSDKLIACSDEYVTYLKKSGVELPADFSSDPVFFRQIVDKQFQDTAPPDVVRAKVDLELARHRIPGGWQRDAKVAGEWHRRVKSLTSNGNVVGASLPIDELIRKSTALSKAKKQLEYQAFHDPLTGLPNRRALTSHLRESLLSCQLSGERIAVLHVDLDKFKAVNDTLGHDAGDHVLAVAARILKSSIRGEDFIARVGGDEFVAVCHNVDTNEDIAEIAQRIVSSMKEPISYNEEYCRIGASVGIVISEPGSDADQLLTEADHALYESKRRGRGCFDFFLPVFRDRHMALLKNVNLAREAMMLSAFEPFFQPQICAHTGKLIGLEALARWLDREKGTRHPKDFFYLLSEAHLMADLDTMIFEKSIKALSIWDEAEAFVPRISINASAEFLSQNDLIERVKWLLDDAGLDPSRIGFEILEEAVSDDDNPLIKTNVENLKKAGFHIALDHFGTGDASVAGLRKLRFDRVKIDEAFVINIENDAELRTISSALIGLIRNLGMEPMWTGLESDAQIDTVVDLDCTNVQGFAVARPMPAKKIPIWLSEFGDREQDLGVAV